MTISSSYANCKIFLNPALMEHSCLQMLLIYTKASITPKQVPRSRQTLICWTTELTVTLLKFDLLHLYFQLDSSAERKGLLRSIWPPRLAEGKTLWYFFLTWVLYTGDIIIHGLLVSDPNWQQYLSISILYNLDIIHVGKETPGFAL